ncbi:MAG: flagellar hook-basal body complex protein FliE [Candidatus Magnetoovum sp. WYHC-5]|nr:flagellar hook-basal body complex protein FliE [Candidatus Magnetoovum sp. WYHC-5]
MREIGGIDSLLKTDVERIDGGFGLERTVKELEIPKGQEGEFGRTFKDAINKVNSMQKEADMAVQSLSSGGDVTTAMLAMEKANMSFQLMVEVRNKLLSAYEEVMRMNV